MDKNTLILVSLIYILIGTLVLAIDRRYVRKSFRWYAYRSPFWAGFNFGLYQWSIIILYPIWLIQRLIK
jgi:hypothetical protein